MTRVNVFQIYFSSKIFEKNILKYIHGSKRDEDSETRNLYNEVLHRL